jgi:hypothetical protein
MHRQVVVPLRSVSLRVQDATGRSIATRCIAMLYRATRPRELPSSVNQVLSCAIAMLSVAMPNGLERDAAGQAR